MTARMPRRSRCSSQIATRESWVKVHRLPQNGGKGAAVMAGCDAALAAGFTHALQIDADGQHDVADAARLLEAVAPTSGRDGQRRGRLRLHRAALAALRPLSHARVGVDQHAVVRNPRFDVRPSRLSTRGHLRHLAAVPHRPAHGFRHRDHGAAALERRAHHRGSDARDLSARRRLAFQDAERQRLHQPHAHAPVLRNVVAIAGAARRGG